METLSTETWERIRNWDKGDLRFHLKRCAVGSPGTQGTLRCYATAAFGSHAETSSATKAILIESLMLGKPLYVEDDGDEVFATDGQPIPAATAIRETKTRGESSQNFEQSDQPSQGKGKGKSGAPQAPVAVKQGDTDGGPKVELKGNIDQQIKQLEKMVKDANSKAKESNLEVEKFKTKAPKMDLNEMAQKLKDMKQKAQEAKDAPFQEEEIKEAPDNKDIEQAVERRMEQMAQKIADDIAEEQIPIQIDGRPMPVIADTKDKHYQYKWLVQAIGCCTPQFAAGIYIGGPAGSFKTTAVEQAAADLGMTLFLCVPQATKHDVVGYVGVDRNYVETQVSAWVRHEGDAILCVDEVDGNMPQAQLAFNLIAANGKAIFGDKVIIVNGDGKYTKVLVCTANTWGAGADAEYVGRAKLDGAFRNRFPVSIPWDYDTRLETRICKGMAIAIIKQNEDLTDAEALERTERCVRMVKDVQAARKYFADRGIKVIVSPRNSMAAVNMVARGFDPLKTWEFTVTATLSDDQANAINAKLEIN
jgi:hypothetical protein